MNNKKSSQKRNQNPFLTKSFSNSHPNTRPTTSIELQTTTTTTTKSSSKTQTVNSAAITSILRKRPATSAGAPERHLDDNEDEDDDEDGEEELFDEDLTIATDYMLTTNTPVPSQNPSSAVPSRVSSSNFTAPGVTTATLSSNNGGRLIRRRAKQKSSHSTTTTTTTTASGSVIYSSSTALTSAYHQDGDREAGGLVGPAGRVGSDGSHLSSSRRTSGRHTCSVSEFNRFKNALLMTKRASTSSNRLPIVTAPNFLLTFAQYHNNVMSTTTTAAAASIGATRRPISSSTAAALGKLSSFRINSTGAESSKDETRPRSSKIRSIYEEVEREMGALRKKSEMAMSNVEVKRANHLHNMRLTHALLSSSLSVKKLN